MAELIIYKNGTPANVRARVGKWEQNETFMGECFITCSVESPAPIEWEIGDWCEFRGERFTLNYEPTCIQSAGIGESGKAYVYENIKFESVAEELSRCDMLDVIHTSGEHSDIKGTNYTGGSNFSLYCYPVTAEFQGVTKIFCAAHVLLDRIHANLLRLYGTTDGQPYDGTNAKWNIYIDDSKCETDGYLLTISGWKVSQALAELHNTFTLKDGSGKKLDYIIRGRNIIVGDVSGIISQHPELEGLTGYLTDIENNGEIFNYGYGKGFNTINDDGKGLFKITRNANSEQQVVTRLRAVGSTKNIPYRYYSGNYGLPQSMFITNLQLPQTFVPYEGEAEKKPDWQFDNKQLANEERDRIYGIDETTGLPNVRHVLGATNDAYIDKNDNAESCPEGIREATARWDGSDGDLPEIYPTIKEATYGELRANAVPDMDGNTGNNAFPNYGTNERIDLILAPGEKCNFGDGIMSSSEMGVQTKERHLPATIDTQVMTGTYTMTKQLFATEKWYKGNCFMSFTEQAPVIHLWMNIGRYESAVTGIYNIKAIVKLIVKAVPVAGGEEVEVATYTYGEKTLTTRPARNDTRTSEYYLPDFGTKAKRVSDNAEDSGSWNVDKLTIPVDAYVKGYISVQVTQLDPLPAGYSSSLEWYVGLPEGYVTELVPECQFGYTGADTYKDEPFRIIIKDNGIDWNNLTLSSDESVKITMNSGYCMGREFEVNTGSDIKRINYTRNGVVVKGWDIECSRAMDNSIGAYYPSEISPISADDEYVVTGIELPDAYVRAAETRLLIAATEYLLDNQETKFTYQPVLDELYLQRDIDRNELAGTPEKSIFYRLHAGMRFTFKYNLDDSTGETFSLGDITIEQVTIRMGESVVPRVELKLNDEVSESTQQKLRITVDRIYGSLFGGGGGGGIGSSMPALLQFMRTEGTKMFLRKDIDDEAAGNVTFDQTIDVKGSTTLEGDLDARGSVTHGGTTVHQGQTTHNALARFNQDAEIPADSTERVMGTIKFMAPLSDGTETTPQERGYINGNGNAQFQTLDVKGRADLEGVAHIHELISEAATGQAEDFIDGYDGHGLRIWKEDDAVTGAPKWHITADYLTIRQQMKVFELLIQKIRSTGGTIVVSNANGKVKSVSKSVDNTWRLTFETGCDFAVGDIIRCQSWKNMREQGSHVETSAWTGKVYAVQGTGEDAVVIIPDTAEWFSGSTPKEGDECVQWGSTNEARQNIIYITAAEGDNPAVDMLGEVTGPGTGNLHVRIGKLDGISTGSNVLIPQGWGLYADNAFLKGKFVLENGDDVYQRFVLQNGRMESTIRETRALTTGDSIIANPAFLDGFQPWNYYHVTSQLLSDGEVILSDGEKLLSGVGDATKYVGLVTEGMRTFVRIVDNESTDPDIGIEQDVTFMRQVEGKKTVELSFEYRIHESGDVLITLDSYKDGLVGSLSTEKTSDLYGLQSTLVKDGEWHTARVYGTYVSGNGSIQVCAKGNVDLSAFQLYEAVGVQSLSTSITQTSEQIALQAERITQQGNQIVRMNSSINEQADQITALSQKVVTDEDGKITNISTAGLVTTDNMAGQMASNVSNPYVARALQKTYPTKEDLALYVLKSAYDQAVASINSALDNRYTKEEAEALVEEGTSGFVNEDSLASMFSGYWTYWKYTDEGASTYFPGYAHDSEGFIIDGEGNRQLKYNVSASISTFNFVEYANEGETWVDEHGVTHTYREGEIKGGIQLRADMIQQLAETIEIKANQIDIESGEVIFHNENGSSSMSLNTRGDIVFSGVTHNQEQIINTSTGVNADLILNSSDSDTLPYYCGLYVGNLPSSGLLDTFDLLMCGDIIRVKQGRVGHSYIMPFYFPEYNTARVEGGVRYDRNGDLLNSNDWHIACRTKTRSGGTLHYMTLDEMLKMVGRRITILFEYNDAGSAIYNLEMFRIDGEYFQDNEYHDGQISVRGELVGDRITSTLAVHYELCMGTYKNHSGNFGTCLYWHRLGGTSGDLTDWNDLP